MGKLWGQGNKFLCVGKLAWRRREAFSERSKQAGKKKRFRERGKQTVKEVERQRKMEGIRGKTWASR
jgi:hypothetical protein